MPLSEGDDLNSKDRLAAALAGESVDRPPVICPGGMMSAATTSLLNEAGGRWHTDPAVMAGLALDVHFKTGFENLGIPFCMTVEAEALGSRVDLGGPGVEPLVAEYSTLDDPEGFLNRPLPDPEVDGRMPVVLKSIGLLKGKGLPVPVIGNITGPFSTLTSVFDPLDVFRLMRKNPGLVNLLLDRVTEFLLYFADCQLRRGADVMAIADPTATGEIIGRKNFAAFLTPRIRRMVDCLKKGGTPVILHICGDASGLVDELAETGASALSFDSAVDLVKMKEKYPDLVFMGNISTHLLHQAWPDRVSSAVRRLLDGKIDVIAPACGVSLQTPLENLRAMTVAVMEAAEN